MAYDYKSIEKKWQAYWAENKSFAAKNDSNKPKYYVLDMFPYPSGAGLHVGHPLGYIASDIYTRYKRLFGYNVLHPMGYDAFGLPAEQYAIQTGQHPATTTDENIKRYRKQLDIIGLSFDWDREVRTYDPKYYKWTQWAFTQMFESYYDDEADKAGPISELISQFESSGSEGHNVTTGFSSEEWQGMSETDREYVLSQFRIAYQADTPVNWCPELGTVLANDEVKDGLSVRGGYPVEQKVMKQWNLRVSAYAQRLLDGLERLDWSDSIKEVQRNWIGRSEGAEMTFGVKGKPDLGLEIYTTRPDTLFGVSFMVLAPESEYVSALTTQEQKQAVDDYLEACKKKTQRERQMDVKTVSGVFTGSYAIHPFTGEDIPVWIGDYVLAGYGTGAIMAVPAHDQRDWNFAHHFNLPIVPVYEGDVSEGAVEDKDGTCINSDFISGLRASDAISKMLDEIEKRNLGRRKTNYRLRDAIFSRQRYWGEPFPVYFDGDQPRMLPTDKLPLELPSVDAYLPTEDGDPPLGRAKNWQTRDGQPYEMSTMPGFAGSSAYFLRYMDPHNDEELVSKEAVNYWQDVDLYVGGNEHATGHLIYSRFWNKFLYDLGYICKDEPFKKLLNQGMIQGRSNFVYRLKDKPNTFVSHGLKSQHETQQIHVDVNIVRDDILDQEAFRAWRPEFKDAEFVTEEADGRQVYRCGWAVEKMSKSMFNVVNPDDVVEKYGADTLRLYEMFLGPIEQSKPWNTQGLEGVHRFLNKTWNLCHDGDAFAINDEKATPEALKILHTCIKKVSWDMDHFSFNTSVSAFMIAVNELAKIKCRSREIIEPLMVLMAPFAPHIAEEIWSLMEHEKSIDSAKWPEVNESYLVESTFKYPVSFNGKMRFLLELPLDYSKDQIESAVLGADEAQKYLDGKVPKKVIVVPKKIVNIVI